MTAIADVTEADFEQAVIAQDGLVLLDLWAPWCAPCRALAPVLDDLAGDFTGEVAILKIDIEAEAGLRDRLGISSVPTLVLYRGGVEIDRAMGVQSRARLAAWLEGHL